MLKKIEWLSNSYSALQHQFQNEFTAEIGQHEYREAAEGPADRYLAAPAELVAPPQQHGKNQPGGDGKEGFMGQVLGEDVFQFGLILMIVITMIPMLAWLKMVGQSFLWLW